MVDQIIDEMSWGAMKIIKVWCIINNCTVYLTSKNLSKIL